MNKNDKSIQKLETEIGTLPSSLLQTIPAMLHSIDATGAIVEVSQKWLETLGYSRSEVIGRKSADFLTEESRAFAVENVLPEFFRTGRCVDVPYQIVTRDGRILDVLLSATCERDERGQVRKSVAIMQDITARKRAERKLDAAKAYAENLLRTANALVVELDAQGHLRRMNEAAERISGYAAGEFRGGNWFQRLVPKSRYADVWKAFVHLLSTGEGGEFECPIQTKSGGERQILWRNSRVTEHDIVLGTLSVGIDVTDQRATEKRLSDSESALREAQSVAQIGSWVLDYQTQELCWTDEIFRLIELDPATAQPSKKAFLDAIHPEDRDEVNRAYKRALRSRAPYEIRHRLLLGDGTLKYVHQRSEISFSPTGEAVRAVGTVQDVTMNVLQELALQESEERFRTIADFMYDWEYWQGENKEILYINPSCQRVTGYSQAEFINDPELLTRIVHPDDREHYQAHLCLFHTDQDHHLDFRIVTKDGRVRWIAHGCRPVRTDNRANGRRVSNRDITDLKSAEQLAQQLAYFDVLTGLPNRRMLMDRLAQAVPLARRLSCAMAIMFVDLDRFKHVNDTFGHDVGDALLVEVAQRFSACIRASDTVARTGGDEFIVLLPEVADADSVTRVARKMLEALSVPVCCYEHSLDVSASIGIAVLDVDGTDDGSELMKKADMAMYAAKQAGRNGYRVFAA